MLQRVFVPSQAPERYAIYTKSTWQNKGLIGTDTHYKFHKHLKMADGVSYAAAPTDTYVWVVVTPMESTSVVIRIMEFVLKKIFFFIQSPEKLEFEHLPASLFQNARENETLSIKWDGRPVKLVLKQQSHNHDQGRKNFETFFQEFNRVLSPSYLFEEDIPAGSLCLGTRPLTQQARIRQGTNILQQANKELIDTLSTYLNTPKAELELSQIDSHGEFILGVGAPGVTEDSIIYLVDQQYFFIGMTKNIDINAAGFQKHLHGEYTLPPEADPMSVKCTHTNNGYILFTFQYKSRVNTPV